MLAGGATLGVWLGSAESASAWCTVGEVTRSGDPIIVDCPSTSRPVPGPGGGPCIEVFYPDATINPTGQSHVTPGQAVVFYGVHNCL